MGSIQVAAASAAVTVNGTAAGLITVGSSTPFKAGARGHIVAGAGTVVQVQIVNIDGAGAGTIGLKVLPDELPLGARMWDQPQAAPTYGKSDCTPFTVAGAWVLWQPAQIVAVPRTSL